MSDLARIEQLATLFGISGEYNDWAGNAVTVPTEYKLPILEAMGVDVSSDETITRSYQDKLASEWHQVLPPVIVLTQGESSQIPLRLASDKLDITLEGSLELEDGENTSPDSEGL